MWKLYCCHYSLFCLLLLARAASAENHVNIANQIVDLINANRSAAKLPKLYNSPGLGCMALQFISECMGNCSSSNNFSCHRPEADITEVYAPNCGVELPTVDIISGRLVGCQWSYLTPEEVFSHVLVPNKSSLSLLHSKDHDEVGVGFVGGHHGPFFWSALFSSGKTNSTFVLEGGTGIPQKNGCFSGRDFACSSGTKLVVPEDLSSVLLMMLLCFVIGILTC